MNQLSIAEKRFPRGQQDIAADFFALRKIHNGTRWVKETSNTLNPASHCDIAWAAALASCAHASARCQAGCTVLHDNFTFDGKEYHSLTGGPRHPLTREQAMLLSDDPNIWRPLA